MSNGQTGFVYKGELSFGAAPKDWKETEIYLSVINGDTYIWTDIGWTLFGLPMTRWSDRFYV